MDGKMDLMALEEKLGLTKSFYMMFLCLTGLLGVFSWEVEWKWTEKVLKCEKAEVNLSSVIRFMLSPVIIELC